MLLLSVGSFLGSLAAGLLAVYIVPRVCQVFLETDKTYSLYGVHYRLQTVVARFSNSRFFNLCSATAPRSSTTCGCSAGT
jgi:hypothetical protein